MATHKYNQVNPLANPVSEGDRIIAESGEVYLVKQTMSGEFWLQHSSGHDLTRPVFGQIEICAAIDYLSEI